MDACLLARLTKELAANWKGAHLQAAWVDRVGRLVLRLRGGGRTGHLLLSADPDKPGLGLVEKRPPCPPRPPALAAFLRARARGGRLTGAVCTPFDRVVRLEFSRPDEQVSVVLEVVGRRPRLVALDAGGVARVASRWDELGAPVPRVLAGRPYRQPAFPAGWTFPAEVVPATVGVDPATLVPADLGFPPALFREFLRRAVAEDPWAVFVALRDGYGAPTPLYRYPDGLSVFELQRPGPPPVVELDVLEAAGRWLSDEQPTRSRAGEGAEGKARRRLERRLSAMVADLEALPDPADLRHRAGALAASLHRVPRGVDRCRVPDPLDGTAALEIDLDPKLSAAANLDRLYARARKAERATVVLTRRIEEARARRDRGHPADTAPVRPTGSTRNLRYRRFTSSDGWPIWVGRNRRENDLLTREARSWDLWFHARDGAGAHVLVRKPGREGAVPERTRREAAGLAALYSRRADESRVDVMVVEVARLRRPRGGRPGQVLVSGEQTLRVAPGTGNPRPQGGRV